MQTHPLLVPCAERGGRRATALSAPVLLGGPAAQEAAAISCPGQNQLAQGEVLGPKAALCWSDRRLSRAG